MLIGLCFFFTFFTFSVSSLAFRNRVWFAEPRVVTKLICVGATALS